MTIRQKILYRKDVREMLGCSNRTIDRLRKSGDLAWFMVKGRVAFDRDVVDNYLQKCKETSQLETEQE